MSKTYSAGIVTAYGAAKRAGYQGTYEDFCRQQAQYAENAQTVEQAKNTAVSAASTATTKAGEAATAATAAQTAKTQTEQSASQALTDISIARSGAIGAVQTEGQTQTANARAQAQAAAQSANTASTKASEASASATSAGQSATNAAASATSAAQSANDAQDVLDSIPADYSEMSAEVEQLKADLSDVFTTVVGKNLANTDGAQLGLITRSGALDTAGSGTSYKTTDFIELEANTDYSYACFNNSTYKEMNSRPRKALLLYDASKEPVSATYVNQSNVANVTFNSGDGYKYARISYIYQTVLPQLEKGTDYTYYMPYTSATKLVSLLGDEPLEQIADVYGDFAQCFDIDLHDTATDAVGVLNGAGRLDTTGTSYKTSTYIPIKAGYKYVFAHPRKICLYNADKVFSEIIDNSSSVEYVYSAVQDCLARFSYPNTQTDSSVKITYDGSYSRKLDEAIDFSIRQKSTIENMIAEKNGDPLYGKKWAVCGDSFTNDGGTGTKITDGKYTGKSFTYPWIIGNRHNMDIVKFFEGGRTLAFPAVPDTFVNSLTNPNADWFYQNIPSDVDFITIYLGINDEHHAPSSSGGDGEDNTGKIPIGTISDATTETYLGAWNVVLTWLITNRPNAHIGILVSNGIANKDEYRQGQIAIAEKYGIPYIDLNGDARTPAMLRTSNPNIPSAIKQALITKWAVDPTGASGSTNTHPNDAAQLFESHFIENFLRSI